MSRSNASAPATIGCSHLSRHSMMAVEGGWCTSARGWEDRVPVRLVSIVRWVGSEQSQCNAWVVEVRRVVGVQCNGSLECAGPANSRCIGGIAVETSGGGSPRSEKIAICIENDGSHNLHQSSWSRRRSRNGFYASVVYIL